MKVLPALTTALALVLAGSVLVASSASATVLCSVEAGSDHECLEDHVYKTGTTFKATLKSSFTLEAGFTTFKCTGSELAFKTTSEGGSEKSNVGLTFTSATLSGCGSCSAAMEATPWEGGSVAWTSGTHNGTLTASNARVKVECLGTSCVYGGLPEPSKAAPRRRSPSPAA